MKKLVNVYQAAKGKDQQAQQQQLHQQLTTDTSSANTSVKTQAAQTALTQSYLKDIYKKLELQHKAAAAEIESGRTLGDTLKDYGTKLSDIGPSYQKLATCLKTVAESQRIMEDAKSDLNAFLLNNLQNPIRQNVKIELQQALESEKKYDKARSNYETAQSKLKRLQAEKNKNPLKIQEAEQELQEAKVGFDQTEKESLLNLSQTNSKFQFEVLARMVLYLEAYSDYYEQVCMKLLSMQSEMEDYRQTVEQAMVDFQKSTGIATERILLPRSLKRRHTTFVPEGVAVALMSTASSQSFSKDSVDADSDDEGGTLDRDFDIRKKTLEEMVSSERIYLNHIRSLKQNFSVPLLKNAKDPKFKITEEEIHTLFYCVDDLYTLHSNIFDKLDSMLERYPNCQIGQLFLEILPSMKQYVDYVDNFSKAMDTLTQFKRNKTVANFLKVRILQHGVIEETCEKLDISGSGVETLLSLPLKRVNQYEFWLETIFEHTVPSDPDYQFLEDAVDQLGQLSEVVVKGNVRAKELLQIMTVQKKLNGFQESLLDEDRVLVREGTLQIVVEKKDKKERKLSHRHLFLFNDILVISCKAKITAKVTQAKKQITEAAQSILKGNYDYKSHYPSYKLSAAAIEDTDFVKNAFMVTVNGSADGQSNSNKDSGPKSFILCSGSPAERLEWLQAIARASQEAQSKRVFGVSILEVMKNLNNAGCSLPSIVENSINYIDQKGFQTEGIFRLSGSAVQIEKMKDLFDRGKEVEFEGQDTHAISGLLKMWLRELPEPLLTYNLYDHWIAASNKNQAVEYIKSLLPHLPMYNKFILQALSKLLVKIADNSSVTKMAASNLGIVIGPNLLSRQNADPYDTSDFKFIYNIVQAFIENYSPIFESIEEERKQYEESMMKEIMDKREKELQDKEKMKQEQKEIKVKKEEKMKHEMDLKETQKQKEAKQKEEERKRKEQEELEKKLRKQIEEENAKDKEKMRLQIEEEQKKKWLEQEQERLKKLEQEEFEYRRRREEERKKEEEKEKKLREERQREIELQRQYEEEQRRQWQQLQASQQHQQQTPSPAPIVTSAPQPSEANNTCEGCGQMLKGQGLQALGKKWHSECFACIVCRKPLTGSFLHKDGKPYCPEDFQKVFAKVCAGCNSVIQGQFIKALGREWHTACFVCVQCKSGFSTGFFEKNGLPYCKNCAQTLQ